MSDFLRPLSERTFPGTDSKHAVSEIERKNRKPEIMTEIMSIPDFPKELVEQTAGIVNFLEVALDRKIHPYDGGAIYSLNFQSPDVLVGLGKDLRQTNVKNLVFISPDRMLGKFNFPDETLLIDYKTSQEKPIVTSIQGPGKEITSTETLISKLAEIDYPRISVIAV